MKGKLFKRLIACAMVAAMTVSTPITAFAAEFADNFWVSDGVDEHDPTGTGTGTVSSTNTDTTVLQHNTNIKGIAIREKDAKDPASAIVIDLKEGNTKTLVAEVLYEDPTKVDDATKKVIQEQISWSSSNLEVIRPAARWDDRATCPINAYKGGFASITASLDVDGNGEADYVARVRVMVKKTPTEIHLNLPNNNTLYAGHTYDLTDYVTFGADDEFDEVDFEIDYLSLNDKQKKLITFGKDGVLSLDKKISGKNNNLKVKLTATSGKLSATADVTLSEGVPVTGLTFASDSKKPAYDIADNYDKKTFDYKKQDAKKLTVEIKTKTGTATTDDITWSSSDSKIVRVTGVDGEPLNVKTETLAKADNKRQVVFEGLSVGKATVTATSTSGKSAKVNVTVTATLLKIESVTVEDGKTYSGKATSLVVKRIPAQNQDKLKIVAANKATKLKGVKVKAAIAPVLTPGADLSKVSIGTATVADGKITVADKVLKVEQAKANKGTKTKLSADITGFTIEQSDVELTAVVKSSGKEVDKIEKFYPNRIVSFFAKLNENRTNTPGLEAVSWESSKETVATVIGNGRIKVVGEGTAKITASSVYKDAKGKYKTVKKAFTIKSTPKCEEIVLKSNLVKVQAGKNAVINVKTQLPKKAADPITWYIYGNDGSVKQIPASKTVNDKKCTIPTTGYKAGDVITVVAVTGSVEAEAKVVIVNK